MITNAYSSQWFELFMPSSVEASSWQADVAFLSRHLPLSHYRRVLDLCCGYGRHAIGLARQGYQVTGFDRDVAALAEAERRSRHAGAEVAFITGDMRELDTLPDTFDAVINMWQS